MQAEEQAHLGAFGEIDIKDARDELLEPSETGRTENKQVDKHQNNALVRRVCGRSTAGHRLVRRFVLEQLRAEGPRRTSQRKRRVGDWRRRRPYWEHLVEFGSAQDQADA